MHIYENEIARAEEIIAGAAAAASFRMPAMPKKSLDTINELAQLEAALRHSGHLLSEESIDQWILKADKLGSYWGQFYLVLLFHSANKISRPVAKAVRDSIQAPFINFMPEAKGIMKDAAPLDLSAPAARSAPDIMSLDSRRMRSVKRHIEQLEAKGEPLAVSIIWKLQERFSRLAARSSGDVDVSESEFLSTLEAIREGR
jgi:hypothetical protein